MFGNVDDEQADRFGVRQKADVLLSLTLCCRFQYISTAEVKLHSIPVLAN